jgi:hypothetical protein
LRDQLNNKFNGIKHKWFTFPFKSNEFSIILDRLTIGIRDREISKDNAMHLVKSFKENNFVFVKYKSAIGRSRIQASCELIDKDNNKLKIILSPNIIIDSSLLEGTPKGLKLYRKSGKKKGAWKKPNDGFIDSIEYPSMEEELTELGYEMYKDWHNEIKNSGMTRDDYVKKLFNVPFLSTIRD